MMALVALIAATVTGLGLQVWMRRLRRRRIAARRRIELPNSHYAPAAVVRRAELDRWSLLRDDPSIHPLNREEVSRLLAIAEAAGPEALSTRARMFLDTLMSIRKS